MSILQNIITAEDKAKALHADALLQVEKLLEENKELTSKKVKELKKKFDETVTASKEAHLKKIEILKANKEKEIVTKELALEKQFKENLNVALKLILSEVSK